MVAGWGKMAHQQSRTNRLETLDVPLASWDACQRVYAPTGALRSPKALGNFFSHFLKGAFRF